MQKNSGLFLFSISLSALLLFEACQPRQQGQPRHMMYFDLAGFLDAQGAYLDSVPSEIKRLNSINGNQEEVSLTQVNWSREMNYLYEADLNRPSWQGSFRSDSLFAPDGLLQSVRYTPLDEDLPVQLLSIHYNAVSTQIESIEATVKDKNMLYDAGRTMRLQLLPDASGKNRVSSYSIEGRQKVIFQDPVTFEVAGRILYLND
jgi:hypothetical protein